MTWFDWPPKTAWPRARFTKRRSKLFGKLRSVIRTTAKPAVKIDRASRRQIYEFSMELARCSDDRPFTHLGFYRHSKCPKGVVNGHRQHRRRFTRRTHCQPAIGVGQRQKLRPAKFA